MKILNTLFSNAIIIGNIIIVFVAIIVMCFFDIQINEKTVSYDDIKLFIQFISGLAPCLAAFSAFYMWSKNREKEIKNLEYKNKYYERIFDLRLKSYNELEKLFTLLDQSAGYTCDNTTYPYHYFYHDRKEFDKINNQMQITMKDNTWINSNTRYILKKMNVIITSSYDYIYNNNKKEMSSVKKDFNKKYKELDKKILSQDILLQKDKNIDRETMIVGIIMFKEVGKWCRDIRECFFNDMLNLYKIEEFINESYNEGNESKDKSLHLT